MTYHTETVSLNDSSKMELSSSRPVQLWKKVVGAALLSTGLIYAGKNGVDIMVPSANVLSDHKAIDQDTAIKMLKKMVDEKVDEVGGIEEYQKLVLYENKKYSHYDSNVGDQEGVQVMDSSTSGPNKDKEIAIFGGALCDNLDTDLVGGVVTTEGCIGWFPELFTAQVALDVKVYGFSVYSTDLAVGGNTKFPITVTVPFVGKAGITLEVHVFPDPKYAQICISLLIVEPCTPKIYF